MHSHSINLIFCLNSSLSSHRSPRSSAGSSRLLNSQSRGIRPAKTRLRPASTDSAKLRTPSFISEHLPLGSADNLRWKWVSNACKPEGINSIDILNLLWKHDDLLKGSGFRWQTYNFQQCLRKQLILEIILSKLVLFFFFLTQCENEISIHQASLQVRYVRRIYNCFVFLCLCHYFGVTLHYRHWTRKKAIIHPHLKLTHLVCGIPPRINLEI